MVNTETNAPRISLLSAPELNSMYGGLGLSPPIWHETECFLERIAACIDDSSLELERSYIRGDDGAKGGGMAAITDGAGLHAVLLEAEESFHRWAQRAQNRQEFDETINLLSSIRGLLAADQPVRSSMVIDLLGRLWCGRNWERVPEALNERRVALDHLIRNVGLAGDCWMIGKSSPGDAAGARTYSHLQAAQSYVANDWMHAPWLTTVVARAMLYDLRLSLGKRERGLSRWWHHPVALAVIGSILWEYAGLKSLGLLLLIAAIAEGFALCRVEIVRSKLDQIISEIDDKIYSGRVLAERLERLNGSTLEVPSILPEVLRI